MMQQEVLSLFPDSYSSLVALYFSCMVYVHYEFMTSDDNKGDT